MVEYLFPNPINRKPNNIGKKIIKEIIYKRKLSFKKIHLISSLYDAFADYLGFYLGCLTYYITNRIYNFRVSFHKNFNY